MIDDKILSVVKSGEQCCMHTLGSEDPAWYLSLTFLLDNSHVKVCIEAFWCNIPKLVVYVNLLHHQAEGILSTIAMHCGAGQEIPGPFVWGCAASKDHYSSGFARVTPIDVVIVDYSHLWRKKLKNDFLLWHGYIYTYIVALPSHLILWIILTLPPLCLLIDLNGETLPQFLCLYL